MLIAFFALATGVAMVVRRPPIEKALIVLSSIPIAIVSNVARITATGIMHVTVGEHIAGLVFHDFAGWFMMPLAMGLLFFVLHCLSRLFIEPAETTRPRVRVVTRVPLA
jgi:exosortase/archaeosortase family protein